MQGIVNSISGGLSLTNQEKITVIADGAIEKGSYVYGKAMPITDMETFLPVPSGTYNVGEAPWIPLGTLDYRCTTGEYNSRDDETSRQAIIKKDLSLLYSTVNTSNERQGFFVPNQSDTEGFVMDISNSGSTGDWSFELNVQPATVSSTTKLTRSGTKKTLTLTDPYHALRVVGVKKLNANIFLVFLHGYVADHDYGLWVIKIELSGTTYTPSLQEYKGVVDEYFGSIIDFVSSGEYTLFYTSGGYAFEMRFIENTKTIVFGAIILVSGKSNISELSYDANSNNYIIEAQLTYMDNVNKNRDTYTFTKIKLVKIIWNKGNYSSDDISEEYRFFPLYLRGTNVDKIVPYTVEQNSNPYYNISLLAYRNYLNTKIKMGYFIGKEALDGLICGIGLPEVISACNSSEIPTDAETYMYSYKWIKWNNRFFSYNAALPKYNPVVSLVFPTTPAFKVAKYTAANNSCEIPIGIALTSTTSAEQEIKIALIE